MVLHGLQDTVPLPVTHGTSAWKMVLHLVECRTSSSFMIVLHGLQDIVPLSEMHGVGVL